jgi:glutathione S-transferase
MADRDQEGRKLYLLHRCPFAHRASIALQEKQLTFAPTFFARGERPPELEAIGQHAKSPTLFDGAGRIWDAQIILEYLEDRYPERPLLPAEAGPRAEARMLMSRAASELGAHLEVVTDETVYKPKKDEARVAHAVHEFLATLERWDRLLEGRSFLVGPSLTLADITLFTIFPSMRGLSGTQIPPERPHLRAWYDRIAARPTAALLEPAAS